MCKTALGYIPSQNAYYSSPSSLVVIQLKMFSSAAMLHQTCLPFLSSQIVVTLLSHGFEKTIVLSNPTIKFKPSSSKLGQAKTSFCQMVSQLSTGSSRWSITQVNACSFLKALQGQQLPSSVPFSFCSRTPILLF